ncbi:MAG: hydroxymethylbilane synthase [Anaerolineae bacterium]
MRLIVGTRGSQLARLQTHWVVTRLRARFPDLEIEERVIQTQGDGVRDRPLRQIEGRGLFVRRIEEALLAGEIDLAVHSLKDLPTEMPAGLAIGAVPGREDPRDALVSRGGLPLAKLPAGAVVGTSSRRRAAQLLHLRADLTVRDMRGNVDSRLRKVEGGGYDAVVMAAAGLVRLGATSRVSQYFPVDEMVPAPGQGALAVEVREGDEPVTTLLAGLDAPAVRSAVEVERALLRVVGGGCALPVGGYAEVRAGCLHLTGMVGTPDGRVVVKGTWSGETAGGLALAEEAGRWLLAEFRRQAGVEFLGQEANGERA